MMAKTTQPASKRRRLSPLVLIGSVIAVWLLLQFVWFDSYSWVRYRDWQKEHEELLEENARLQAEIIELRALLEAPPSDEVIEKIAREQYGMRREGETVYRVEK
ncbi:MAG: septum formation initiator family protein [Bacteroidetes bacterium]|nr:septum formation initiator family protein [Bacteroidota bacterium]